MKVKKLTVLVQPRAARSTGCRSTSMSPSRTRPRVDVRRGGGGVSVTGMRLSSSAEPRNETASTTIATGALSAWTSPPPTAGPAMKDSDRLMLSLLVASTYADRGTRATKNA